MHRISQRVLEMRMKPDLEAFLSELDAFDDRVPLDLLTQRLESLDITIDDVQDFVEFSPERYRRNLLYDGRGFQALILCWLPGQRSPIHDHEGSTCGVRVLKGVATETIFDRTSSGLLRAIRSQDLPEGYVCGSQDADIHQMSNLQDGSEMLVTLHVYSPPLLTMNTYSLTDGLVTRFEDPVHEFAQGAGI